MRQYYKIEITEIVEGIPSENSSWKQLFSDEVWKSMSQAEREKAGGEQYAYRKTESQTSEQHEIYTQIISELDLPAIVAVINRIGR